MKPYNGWVLIIHFTMGNNTVKQTYAFPLDLYESIFSRLKALAMPEI